MRYLFEEYAFDTDRRELHRGADVVSIAPQVFDLLDYLIRNRDRVVSKDDLINAIWNGRSVSDAALTTRLNAVRTAIGDSGEEQRLIKTLPRKGFRFVGPVLEAQGPGCAAFRSKKPLCCSDFLGNSLRKLTGKIFRGTGNFWPVTGNFTCKNRKRPFTHLFLRGSNAICSHREIFRWRTRCRQFASVTARLFGGPTTRLGFTA